MVRINTRYNILKCSLLICLTAIGLTARAQKFSLGVKGGPLVNWAHFANSEDKSGFSSEPAIGFTVGGDITFPLKNNYAFLAEGAYSLKGRRVKFNDGMWENNNTYTFLDLSMFLRKTFRLHIKENLPTKWFVSIGPQVSYWLTAKGRIVVEGQGPSYNIIFNQVPDANFHNMYYNDVNEWLFGLSAGVGFEAPIKKDQRVSFELRFVSGHTYLGGKNSAYIEILGFEDKSLKQNLKVLQFTVAYTWDFDLKEGKKGKSTMDKAIKKKRR